MNREEYYASLEAYKDNYLEHHGILGQKWGIRRYQNPDGSYTAAGKKRYGIDSEEKSAKQYQKRLNDLDRGLAYNKKSYNPMARKESKYISKSEKAEIKGNSKKAERYKAKAEKIHSKADKYLKNIKAGEKETKDLLNEIQNKGLYNVHMSDTLRNTTKMKDFLKPYFWNIKFKNGNMRIGNLSGRMGTKYEVSEKPKAEKKPNKAQEKSANVTKLTENVKKNINENQVLRTSNKSITSGKDTTRLILSPDKIKVHSDGNISFDGMKLNANAWDVDDDGNIFIDVRDPRKK